MQQPPPPYTPPGDTYRQAMSYFYAQNYEAAVSLLSRAYISGNLNAGWVLAQCYQIGFGVIRNFEATLNIARDLINRGYALGHSFLVEAYACGWGVPVNPQMAAQHRMQLYQQAGMPQLGVEDELRHLAFSNSATKDTPELPISDELFRRMINPDKYLMKAIELLPCADENPQIQQHIRYLVDTGISAGSIQAKAFKGFWIYNHVLGYDEPPQNGIKLLYEAADTPKSHAYMNYLAATVSTDEAAYRFFLNKFWDINNLGHSLQNNPTRLPFHLSLENSPFGAMEKVLTPQFLQDSLRHVGSNGSCVNRGEAAAALRQNAFIFPLLPKLVIRNQTAHVFSNLSLRVCIKNAGEWHFQLRQPLGPHSTLEQQLSELDVPWDENIYLEILSPDGRKAELTLDSPNGLDDFVSSNPVPVNLNWESNFFGSIVLNVRAQDTTIENITIQKVDSDAKAVIPRLRVSDAPHKIGWCEFSDAAGLKQGELFIISANGYSPLLCTICNSLDDQAIE